MPTKPQIPPELKLGPFTVSQARAVGISATALRGIAWMRLQRGLYCWSELAADPWRLLTALQRLLHGATFAGRTAAWMHGLGLDPMDPIEVIVPRRSGIRSRHGLYVRRTELSAGDIADLRGLHATSALRTLSDLCARLSGIEVLAMIDAAVRLRLTDPVELSQSRSKCLRALAPLTAPAESPMETRLRWHLMKEGLPRPEVQRNLHDAQGRFVGRVDLYYPQARLVIEFDGGHHRDRLVADNRRQNLLIDSGFTVLRFTSDDVYSRPDTIVAQVRRGLSARAAAFARRPAAAQR